MSNFLIWVGAGEAQSLNFNYEIYNKVIFIDPLLPTYASNASNKSEKFISLAKGVVPSDFTSHSFSIFNNDELSSFLEPQALKSLYPNLVTDEVRDIETVTIFDIIREYNVAGNENTLVLDIPCLSAALLEQLKDNGSLKLFNSIIVTAGKEVLYSNSRDMNAVTEFLSSKFYELVESCSDDDDILTCRFEFNQMLEKTAFLEKQVQDLSSQLELLADESKNAESEKDELKLLLSNAQVAFRETQEELQAVTEKAQGYDSQLETLKEVKSALESELQYKRKELEELKAQEKVIEGQLHDEQQRALLLQDDINSLRANEEMRNSKVASLENSLKTANEKAEASTQQLDSLEKVKQELESKLSESEIKNEAQHAQIDQLEKQLQVEQENSQHLNNKLAHSAVSEKNYREKLASLEESLKTSYEKAEAGTQQLDSLEKVKQELESKLLESESKVEAQHAQIDHLEKQLQVEQQSSQQLTNKLEHSTVSEKSNRKKIASLENSLKTTSEKAEASTQQLDSLKKVKQELESTLSESEIKIEAQYFQIDELQKQLQTAQENSHQLKSDNERLKVEKEANQQKVSLLESELKSASDITSVKIEQLTLESDKLKKAYNTEKAKMNNAEAAIEDLKAKLNESEEKQNETYGWFVSRKQQVETLTVQLDALKRENEVLAKNNATALAVSELEKKLTSMLNKQNDDSIEIANALGKHVTRCHEEQKSNIASQFELRKLSALSRLPIGSDPYSMEASNLAELSSLIIQNKYDVILEFGSGLSTVVAASALADKAPQNSSSGYILDKNNISDIENSLPKHIASFEQSSEYFEKTRMLLVNAGVDAYVDLVLAPMVSVPSFEGNSSGGLFYDCAEKLMELKRVLSTKSANILVIVDGPSGDNGEESSRYWALPMVLDYLPQFKLTFFVNNSKDSKGELPQKWKDECARRKLTLNIKQLNTPKGISLLNVEP